MIEVLRYLDLHHISNLYCCGCHEFWTITRNAAQEAVKIPLAWCKDSTNMDATYIPINPFPLLSMLPNLRTVKLYRVSWLPDVQESCPFRVLPTSLDRLEFTSYPFNQDNIADRSQCIVEFDYRSAFPRLRSLRLSLSHRVVYLPNTPLIIPKLPSTLTTLYLENTYRPENVLGYIAGLMDTEGLAPLKAGDDLTNADLPRFPSPLPQLAVLELTCLCMSSVPPVNLVPPNLVHFRWSNSGFCTVHEESDFADYDVVNDPNSTCASDALGDKSSAPTSSPGDEETSNALISAPGSRLRSLNLSKTSDDVNTFIESLPRPLTSLIFTLYPHGHEYPTLPPHMPALRSLHLLTIEHFNVELYANLVQSGANLTYLKTEALPNFNYNVGLYTTLLASVTTLDLFFLPNVALLPPQLEVLRISQVEELWTENDVRGLPQGLIELSAHDNLDVNLIPLLPRSIKRLRINASNEACKLNPPPIDASGIPFGNTAPSGLILTDLPPNLEKLSLYNAKRQLDFSFGRFLPRSLRFFESHQPIRLADPSAGFLSKWTGFFGKPHRELVLEAMSYFPPGCLCRVDFTSTLSGTFNLAQLKDEIFLEPIPNDAGFI